MMEQVLPVVGYVVVIGVIALFAYRMLTGRDPRDIFKGNKPGGPFKKKPRDNQQER